MKNCTGHLLPRFAAIASLIILCHSAHSQTEWKKYTGNPYFVRDITSPYEALAIGSPSVVKVHDTLKMYYAASVTDSRYAPGNAQNRGTIGRIMYAWSTDAGITWNKRTTPVLDTAAAGAWDDYFLDTPEILWDGTTYRLYYFGDTDNLSNGASFGLATSTDGIHFTRSAANPIVTPGQNGVGGWDGLFIESPALLYDNGTYYMAFTGIDTTWRAKVGVATSTDGIHFTKYANNPVVRYGDLYGWDGYMAATPAILKTPNGFEMWYSGVSNVDLYYKTYKWSIGYASSPDFFNWVKYGYDPVLSTYPPNPSPGQPDKEFGGPFASKVLFDSASAKYTMYYENGYGFGQAYAPKDSVLLDPLANWNKTYSHTSGLAFDNTSTTYFNNDQSRAKRSAANTQSVVYNWPNLQSFSARVYYYGNSFTGNMKIYVSPNASTWTEIAFTQTNTDTSGGTWYGTTLVPAAIIAPGNNYVKFEINSGYAAWSPQLGDIRIKSGNRAPTVSITAPADSASYTAPATIALSATAADTDGTISKVEFFEGGNLLGTDSTAPYSYNWSYGTAPDSTLTYNVTARATDNKGAIAWSPIVHVRVGPPATSFYDPLKDWSKTYSHTTNLSMDNSNPAYFENDSSRVKRTTSSIESIVYYHSPIISFSARVYYFSSFTSNMKAYTSPDGTTWTEIALSNSSTVATSAGWYATTIAPSTAVPSGTNYVRLEIRTGFDIWSPQIGGVNISFGTGGSASANGPVTATSTIIAPDAAKDLQIFPNPTNNSATLRFGADAGNSFSIGIYTADGVLLRTVQQGKGSAGVHSVDISTAQLPAGVYIIRLINGSRVQTRQLSVIH